MGNDKIKKGMMRILLANILNMIFSIGTNFLLPRYVSVETYALIKEYQLLLSYVVILQLGFSDGMYLHFGGKDIKSISVGELQKSISTMRVFQGVIAAISIAIAVITKNPILIVASISIFPQNVISYYKNLFQAVGIFEKYSKIMNYTTGLTFFVNVILLFIFHSDNFMFYICGYLFITIFLCAMLEYAMYKMTKVTLGISKFSFCELKEKVSDGILLLFANFSSILLTSMDRWFTKVLLTTLDFAQYSFAVSIESFLNIAVSPISITMYNFFCNNSDRSKIKKILDQIIGFATILMIFAFPIKFIVNVYLVKYISSLNVLFLLFAAQIYLIVVRSVYANLYKARKKQNKYFQRMCIVIIIGFILNFLCYYRRLSR